MDYGKLNTLGVPKMKRNGELYTWEAYTVGTKSEMASDTKKECYIIEKGNDVIVLEGLKKLTENEG